MFDRLSLRANLVGSVLIMGVLGIMLAIVIAETYREYAIDSQRTAFEKIIGLRVDTLLDELLRVSHDLGQAVQEEKSFRKLFRERNATVLDEHLQSQFHQYFVTAGIIKLESLAVYDKSFKLISRAVPENGSVDSGCPGLYTRAAKRRGPQRLKTISELCLVNNRPYLSLLLPIGGLSIKGYLEVVTDPVYSLRKIEPDLGMPLRMTYIDEVTAFSSSRWPSGSAEKNAVMASYSPATQVGELAFTLSVVRDVSEFENQLTATRNKYVVIMLSISLLLGLLMIMVLNKTTLEPLYRLADRLRSIHDDKKKLGEPVIVSGNREVRKLASGFNQMTNELKELYDTLVSRNSDLSQEISDREFAERELKKHRDQLEDLVEQRTLDLATARDAALEASRSKSLFLANMSHELRTPLNAIIGYSEMLLDDMSEPDRDKHGDDLGRIHSAGKHLLLLINDILDLTKVETGKMDLYEEWFDVKDMVDSVSSTVIPLFEKNNNTLRVECPEDIGDLFADITKIRQSLFNLLSNASKFSKNDEIVLTINRKMLDGKEDIFFDVTDHGIGLSQEQQDKLFEAFSQADPSTTRKFGGTGLGLVISQHLCNMMGGGIQLFSTLGGGSTFTIILPVKKGATLSVFEEGGAVQGLSWRSNAVASGNRFSAAREDGDADRREKVSTVLVIDDDQSVRQIMAHFLSQKGFSVQAAAGGEEGLVLAKELKPDVITLDVMMPGLDGWSVLKALKDDPELRDIPVILVTMVENRSMGYSLGATEYLSKPIDKERMVDVLKRSVRSQTKGPVLIIENDQSMRESLQEMLKLEGWEADAVATAEHALSEIGKNPPVLILLDLIMPQMDGFDFLAQLRSTPRWRNIPVLIVTGKELTDKELTMLHNNAAKVVNKTSFAHDDLLKEVYATVADYLSDLENNKKMTSDDVSVKLAD